MKLGIIVGTIRQERLSERLARWVAASAAHYKDTEASLIDLRDYPMPFFDEPKSPRFNTDRHINDVARAWLEKLTEQDAYIFVTPEYNHSIPGVLKNALDYVTWEMARKPATIISHGTVGGARATLHLKEILSESRSAIIPTQLPVIGLGTKIDAEGNLSNQEKAEPHGLESRLTALLDELQWYSDALATARAHSA